METTNRLEIIRGTIESPASFATTLLVLAIDRFGAECTEWLPETYRREFAEDFRAEIPQANIDKLMAASTIVTTDQFYDEVPFFIEMCNVLSGDGFQPQVFNPADALECAWGITEGMLLSPSDSPEPFSEDIRRYIAFVLKEEGIVTPPDVLRIALNNAPPETYINEWSDDPEVFNAMWDMQRSRADEVAAIVQDSASALLHQLVRLPLENGSAKSIIPRLRSQLRAGQSSAV